MHDGVDLGDGHVAGGLVAEIAQDIRGVAAVEDERLMPELAQPIAAVAPDEPVAARYENPHATQAFLLE